MEPPKPQTIGDRIRDRREARGLSLRTLAGLAGISHSHLSRIESGERGADNRRILAALAQALQCSTADLTRQPPVPRDRKTAEIEASVWETLQAIIDTDLDEPPTVADPRPMPALTADIEAIWQLRNDTRYREAARLLPPLLRDLHAHTSGRDHNQALRLYARTADNASFVMRYLGHVSESWTAAERCRDAADALGDPVILGLAAWSQGHAATSCGSLARALRITERGIEAMRDAAGEGAAEMRGQLYMLAAWTSHVLAHPDDAQAWLRKAQEIARETGQTPTLGLNFGPAGIRIWEVSMAIESGEAGKALELARDFSPASMPAKSRLASFYLDLGRALAEEAQDERAVKMLLQAERLGPERIQRSTAATETVRVLRRRHRPGETPGLDGLAERLAPAT